MKIKPESYFNTPHVTGGNTREGADCWGLTVLALREMFGIDIRRHSGSCATGVELARIVAEETESPRFERAERAAPARIAVMVSNKPHHIGVCVDAMHVLHTMEGRGVDITPVGALKRIFNKVEFYTYVGTDNRRP